MIGNLKESFLYEKLPDGLISLDERGLIAAVVSGVQDRIEDLRSYSKNLQLFFAVNNFPQTGPNVVLVDLQSSQGKVYTRSLDLQFDTPADGTAALNTWAAQQLGLDEDDLLDVRYGTDLLRLVDINTLAYLAKTIGAVLYKTSIIPDNQVKSEQQQIIATYFPRLQIKGTERSFEALGRILGFDDVRMTPLWSRLSVRQPNDIGAAANDPDFATESEYIPQQSFSPFYNPLKTNDGPFYTWTGTTNNGTNSTQFYTQAVNDFSPFVETIVLAVQYGTVVDPANGTYALGSSGTDSLGGPHKKAYVDPAGAGVRFQAIAEGAYFNGMVISVGTDSTGTNKILSITDRLSAIKYRSSYFDLAVTAYPDKIEEVFGSSAAQRNKDLANTPALTVDGTAVSPYRPWISGSMISDFTIQDWVTMVGNTLTVVIPRVEASAVNRQLNMTGVTAAGIQVTQAFDEVRAATRFPRKSLSGLLLQDGVIYAAGTNSEMVGTTTPPINFIFEPGQALTSIGGDWIDNAEGTLYDTDGFQFWSSTDAFNWTELGSTNDPSGNALSGVIHNSGTLAGAGNGGVIYTSTDGANTWTLQTSNTVEDLVWITYGGGQYVAVGFNGAITVSSDAVNWTAYALDTGGNNFASVVYAAGLYVAVGTGGIIFTSSDGAIWNSQTSNTGENLRQIIYAGGQFVVVGDNGVVLTSFDAFLWTVQPPRPDNIRAIVFIGNRYVISENGPTIYSSTDVINWTQIEFTPPYFFNAIKQMLVFTSSTVIAMTEAFD